MAYFIGGKMRNLLVSVSIKKDLMCYTITENGSVKARNTDKLKCDINSSSHHKMIYAFTSALRGLKHYITSVSDDINVIFETSNSTFIKWVDDLYSNNEYQNIFLVALKELDDLPITYQVLYNKTPNSNRFLSEEYLTKLKLSTF